MFIGVSLVLSYLLRLPNGNYPTGTESGFLDLLEIYMPGPNGSDTKQTAVSSVFEVGDFVELQPQLVIEKREADRQAAVVEITRVQASPFVFTKKDIKSLWGDELNFEADPPLVSSIQSAASGTRAVRSGMGGSRDPEVANLFLLDAE